MAYTQDTPLLAVKGIGEKTAALYEKVGLATCGDLIRYLPRSYDYYADPITASQAEAGKIQAFSLIVVGRPSVITAGRYKLTTCKAADATGQLELVFFNMPFLAKTLQPRSVHLFRGMVQQKKNGALQLMQPEIKTPAEYDALRRSYQPRYALTKGLKNSAVIRAVEKVLPDYVFPEDYLLAKEREALGLPAEEEALRKIHFPKTAEEIGAARDRLVFDEFFSFVAAIKCRKKEAGEEKNERPMHRVPDTKRLVDALPYALTASQKKAFSEIEADLCGNTVMNRLLQGDVGSGKTILAFLALLLCAANGRQGALMAPTEVLARQHYEDLLAMTKEYALPLYPVLLTGAVKGKERTRVLSDIEDGTANVIIGTHALIQEKVAYHDLSLVITDEQHRFGVRQREALAGKGQSVPVLVMSATPIPRTLAIILYADLSVSQLLELPAERLPNKNLACSPSSRGKVYRFILNEIAKGHQAYVICPAVEESEFMPDLENVTEYTEKLRAALPDSVRIASLNGRMKPAQKDKVMEDFAAHRTDILVSTTVIEVGINVPNATVILIENAERFGLSQLHQLRGRVGRGKDQSYCIFMYSEGIQEKPKRLQILEKSNDGFQIAEEDLKLRGPGDMFGTRQSGEMGFQLADIYEDADILKKAANFADTLLRDDPERVAKLAREVDFRSI
ncbi:MAG: ATP-dependent DNA helicase RecG [Firmicutes bacterium]|nr:ATP-dependent DNA helicase RecG [Bacillota bacterium]